MAQVTGRARGLREQLRLRASGRAQAGGVGDARLSAEAGVELMASGQSSGDSTKIVSHEAPLCEIPAEPPGSGCVRAS